MGARREMRLDWCTDGSARDRGCNPIGDTDC
jgi:hypothetical protein